ncbi:hypothetical protein JB92DRAFT_1909083 [Gautieria morchelliformis]|nr:hypothetical protein JB92DRAFT_1909083 [Gautieria morchelliformis]
MINNLAIRMITLAVGLSALPSALSVCPDRDIGIGIGTQADGFQYGVIYANDCGIIDSRASLDGTFCSINYSKGASVQCDSARVPNSAQTGDGTDWGPCFKTSASCGNENGSDQHVQYCCSRVG